MKTRCKFYKTKGLFSDIYYCQLVDENITKDDTENFCCGDVNSCDFYQLYLKKRREVIISEKVNSEFA